MAYFPNIVKIDLSSIVHNLNQVKRLIDPETKVMGIVKSDAYGHGLLEVSRLLARNGVHSLGVAHLYEALKLREEGIKLPIVILCGIRSREDSEEVVDKDLTPVIFDLSSAELLAKEAARKDKRINIQLKIDTGMGRLGIPYLETRPFIKKIMGFSRLNLEALMSHLSSADEPDSSFTEDQIKNFKDAIDAGHSLGLDLPLNHLANSAGIMGYKESHFNMVRPGIMLYGGLPSPGFNAPPPLEPVMHFRGVVLQTRDFPDQTPVSYGRRYYTKGPKRVAIVSAGYGDGLARSL
ncbi:alanine racemase, partial [Thermodesulfobacteriota bacterium]